MQNAGKHAGDGATADRHASGRRTTPWRSRSPTTGPASTADGAAADGHGFVNMADRLGAFGGVVRVRSAPGQGTTVSGTLPLTVAAA